MLVKSRWLILSSVVLACSSINVFAQEYERVDTIAAARKIEHRENSEGLARLKADADAVMATASPMGEGDPIKWAMTTPGVAVGADGASAFYVRGGNVGNNLITIDGVPVYGYSHLLGLTTVIPMSVTDNVNLTKNGFGGASNYTSSHLNVGTINPEGRPKGAASLNNFMAGAESDGKLSEKLSYVVSARISPIGLEYQAIKGLFPDKINAVDNFKATVFDVFGKLRWQTDEADYVELSGLGSKDRYSFSEQTYSDDALGWSNVLVYARYHREHDIFKTDFLLSANNYASFQEQTKLYRGSRQSYSLASDLKEFTASFNQNLTFSGALNIEYGAKFRAAVFNPGQVASLDNRTQELLGDLYFQADYLFCDETEIKAAVRGSGFYNCKDKEKGLNPEFSFYLRHPFSKSVSVSVSFDRLVQYYHTLEGLPVGWSLDLLVPSGEKVAPETAVQASAEFDFSMGNHSLMAGGFYKYMEGLVYYKYAPVLFNGGLANWEEDVEQGQGHSYGLEMMYKYEGTDWHISGSYTLSKTDRSGFPSINGGGSFHARFDRTHVFYATCDWKGFNASFSLQSGHWENPAPAKYPMHTFEGSAWMADYYSTVNSHHMPMMLRLDIGYRKVFACAKVKHIVNVGVYNVTNHFNPFTIYYDPKGEVWKEMALIPIMPNFGYKLEF